MLTIRNYIAGTFVGTVGIPPWERYQLTGSMTYYVRPDGSDTNTGTLNTTNGAFSTVQKAVDTVLQTLDTAGNAVTIKLADGDYTSSVRILYPTVGGGQINIIGNTTTPTNVTMNMPTGSNAIWVDQCPSPVYVSGLKIQAPGSSALISGHGSFVQFGLLNFGLAGTHMYAYDGGYIQALSNYNISGRAEQHINCQYRSIIQLASALSINLSNTPSFAPFCYIADQSYVNCNSSAFTGSATGQRYVVNRLSGVLTGLGDSNPNYFPGSVGGSVNQGSQYV